jgi:dephospho-CoA kinase
VLRVGLTGGIACGKSVVGKMLVGEGAQVLEADKLSHQLTRPGTPVYEEVVRRFGRGILRADGEVDRPSLARIVFNDKARLQELTSITHPAVIKAQEQWMDDVGRADPHAIAVVEAALIYEAGLAEHFDKIIVVTCTAQNKLERLSKRMGVDLETARLEMQRRSAAQIPDDEKARRADYVVDNSGDPADTQAQLQEIAAELRRLANTTGAQRRSQ